MRIKIGQIIAIAIATYVALLGCSYLGIKTHFDAKGKRLREEAYKSFNSFFSKQDKYVSIAFSGKNIEFKQIGIPKFEPASGPFALLANQKNEKLNEDYGNLFKLYELVSKFSLLTADTQSQNSGWMLNIIEKTGDGQFCIYHYYPYRVGFIRQSDPWLYNLIPSIQVAINESFTYYTKNDNSLYSKCLSDLSTSDIVNAVENEYYEMCKSAPQSIPLPIPINKSDEHDGYMYNGFYKVFNRIDSVFSYQIAYRSIQDPKKYDIERSSKNAAIILTILLIGFIIPMVIIDKKKKRINNECLKERLLRLCNPQRFMSPYDEKKVSVANDIYERLLSIPASDIAALKLLRKQASSNLGVSFIDNELLEQLRRDSNPKRFMSPYDPEKVRLANQLYTRLIDSSLDIDSLEQIQEEIKKKLTIS